MPARGKAALGRIFNNDMTIGHEMYGGGERDRTDDLLRARQALSQLSYTPNFIWYTFKQKRLNGYEWWA